MYADAVIPTRIVCYAVPALRRQFVALLGYAPDSYHWEFIPKGAAILGERAEPLSIEQDHVRICACKDHS